MNYFIILKLLSVILSAIGSAFLLSLGISVIFQNDPRENNVIFGFIVCVIIAFSLAFLFYINSRNCSKNLFRKEALAVIGLGWILASIIGALPYYLIIPNCSISNAIFESTSGLTTTGATVLSNLESLPRSLLFWRAISQWIGGLGVIVFFVAILTSLGAGAKILFSRESSAESAELDYSRVQSGVLRILLLYLGLSLIYCISYKICGMNWFDAVTHMFTTIATGGFSNYSDSISAFNSPLIEWVSIIFMIISGTSFLVLLRVIRGDWKEVKKSSETLVFFGLIIGAITLLTIILLLSNTYDNTATAIRYAAFQAVSIITSTGYATDDFNKWLPITHVLLIGFMIVGGCSGSTAGGLKIIRLIIAIKVCILHTEKAFRSKVVRSVKLNGRTLDQFALENVVTYIVLIALIGHFSLIIFSLMETQMSLEGTLSTIITCLYNVGPGFMEIGPTQTFDFLHSHTKIFLSLIMIMGRLELYAVIVLFSPSLWKNFS